MQEIRMIITGYCLIKEQKKFDLPQNPYPKSGGHYERSFSEALGGRTPKDSSLKEVLNPINHIKASAGSSVSHIRESASRVKHSMGLPESSKELTRVEKSILMADKFSNFSPHKNKNISPDMNNIKKRNLALLEKTNDKPNKG